MVRDCEDSSGSQVFAMMILINDKLESQAFSAIISTLITEPNQKKLQNEVSMIINKARIREMVLEIRNVEQLDEVHNKR